MNILTSLEKTPFHMVSAYQFAELLTHAKALEAEKRAAQRDEGAGTNVWLQYADGNAVKYDIRKVGFARPPQRFELPIMSFGATGPFIPGEVSTAQKRVLREFVYWQDEIWGGAPVYREVVP